MCINLQVPFISLLNIKDVCTLKRVQYDIQDCTERTLDVCCDSTHKVVSDTEGISADYHGINEANVSGS